jgi:hypothetical protein
MARFQRLLSSLATISVLLTAIVSDAVPVVAGTRRIDVGFDVYADGVQALSVNSTAIVSELGYSVDSSIESTGVLDPLLKYRARHYATGRFTAGKGYPTRYSSRSEELWGKKRQVEMRFRRSGLIEVMKIVPSTDDGRQPIPNKIRQGAWDPLSGLLLRVIGETPDRVCSGSTSLFDGQRLHNLSFTAVGKEQVEDAAVVATPLNLPTVKCLVRYERIKGPHIGGKIRRQNRDPLVIWLAYSKKHQMTVPVRLTTQSDYGEVFAKLTDFSVSEVTPVQLRQN